MCKYKDETSIVKKGDFWPILGHFRPKKGQFWPILGHFRSILGDFRSFS